MFEELINLMDSFLDMGVPGYDCIIYHKGKCIFRHYNGYSDLENRIKISGNEKYNIYSCSKPITCTAALQLYEKGLFKLEDILSDYMPEFRDMYIKTECGIKKAKNPIKIKDLFCMTAGFSYNLNSPEIIRCKSETNGRCPTLKLMKYLAQEPLLFEPGERWEYSLCHDVLAAFVEVVSGMKFEEYVKKYIFDALEMKNSTFLLPYDELSTVSIHYAFNEETKKVEVRSKIPDYRFGSEYASGGAGCVSTVDDYIKFLEGLRTGILLKDETIQLMSMDHLTDKQKETYVNEGYSYGLGVRIPSEKNRTDFGWAGAAGSYLGIDRKNEISLFYAQHLFSPPNTMLKRQVLDVAEKVIKENLI